MNYKFAGRTAQVDSEHGKCADIIVPRNELIDKNDRIDNLETRLNHQLSEHSFELEYAEKMHTDEMHETCTKYETTIKELYDERLALEMKYHEERNLINSVIEKRNEGAQTISIHRNTNLKIIISFDFRFSLE